MNWTRFFIKIIIIHIVFNLCILIAAEKINYLYKRINFTKHSSNFVNKTNLIIKIKNYTKKNLIVTLLFKNWSSLFSLIYKINNKKKHFIINHLDRHYSYFELLFKTIPGITGIILQAILVIMLITSCDFIKKKKFEIFSYTHLLYIIYLIALPLHGCMFLFNYGIIFTYF